MLKKTVNYIGWPMIIGLVFGIITYFLPSWLGKDIKTVETVLHIPIVEWTPEDGKEKSCKD